MYKTVRHGENSLQYTILPQTEEVLNTSGTIGKGRDYSPSIHVKRSRSRCTLQFVMFFILSIIVTVVIAAFPIYVVSGVVYLTTPATLHKEPEAKESNKVFVILDGTTPDPGKTGTAQSRKKELGALSADSFYTVKSIFKIDTTTEWSPEMMRQKSSTGSLFNSRKFTDSWILPPITRFLSTTTESLKGDDSTGARKAPIPFARQRASNNDLMLDQVPHVPWTEVDDVIIKPTLKPDVPTSTIDYGKILHDVKPALNIRTFTDRITTSTAVPRKFEDVLITTKDKIAATETVATEKTGPISNSAKFNAVKEQLLDIDSEDEFKDALVGDDEVTTPVDDVKIKSPAKDNWLRSRWPFVDPSSYFQWTGYSAGDNLLLPAILGAALAALLVVAVLAFAIRRRRCQTRGAQHIGKLTADLQADDNTNLLQAENASEDD